MKPWGWRRPTAYIRLLRFSARLPEQAPEVNYPGTMLVRTVKSHGHFRWKKQDVFLTEVLWGEQVGLLPVGDGCHTVYFAHVPLALFDSRTRKTYPPPTGSRAQTPRAVSGPTAPETAKQNLPDKEKLSAMCPG
jgi:hypothetical protein